MPPELEDLQTEEMEAPASVHSALADAFADFEQANPEPSEPPAAPEAQAEQPPAERQRDATGRFAKATEAAQAQQQISQPNANGQPSEAQTAPTGAPAALSATVKAKWANLDPDVQAEFVRRERDMDQGRAQWQQGAERLNRLDQVLAPRAERFRLAGLSEHQAVETLFAAQDYLERDPVGALIYLGRQAGADWNRLFQTLSGAQPQQAQAPRVDPHVAQLTQQVQTLGQQIAQRDAEAQLQPVRNELEAFAADPKNLYFWNVKDRMAALVRTGQATSIADAYEQACWSHPQVKPLMLQAQAQEQAAQQQAQARQRVQRAQQASGSVIGSPSPGGAPGGRSPAPSSVSDGLRAAWDAHS